jgi:putative endonuclease
MAEDRRRALGGLGERAAAEHLARRGYEILERNFRTRFGELDVVARGQGCLVFCEVKTRVGRASASVFGPFSAVGPRKRAQLRRMAGQWLHVRSPGYGAPRSRFDVIGVTVGSAGQVLALEHLEDAF